MQSVISSKDQEIIFYKSQLGDLARAREMSVEAEKQVPAKCIFSYSRPLKADRAV